ncbi:hypothetical protein [Frankia sp. CiP3]|uniref:hypothetical protein n=1 Tax=Frankia sp. CiP3 TaxID=2880971 RepID=UPI001EF6716D|nr:hypothetical protein [Frankia sp. CiP3]
MTSMTTDPVAETIAGEPAAASAQSDAPMLDEELARRLVEQARAEGASLTGPDGWPSSQPAALKAPE